MDKVRRERSANFTSQETDILVSLLKKHQTVLESKQCDTSARKKKDAAWESIQKEFNARSREVFRSIKTLKVKYEGLKRTVRKKSAAIRSELYRGGLRKATPLDSVEEQIKAILSLSTDGLESTYDSDILPQTQESEDDIKIKEEEDEFIDKPAFPIDMESEVIENEAIQNNKALHDTSRVNCVITPTTSASKKWDATSRRNLKSKRYPLLIANAEKNSLFDQLIQAKLEIAQLQKGLLKAEVLEKNKEWEFKEKERKWKEEEYILKLEKLRKDLKY